MNKFKYIFNSAFCDTPAHAKSRNWLPKIISGDGNLAK